MSNGTKERCRNTGGLHFKLAIGDEVYINVDGKQLTIIYQGLDESRACMSFIGPKSFGIGRYHPKKEGNLW